MLKTFLNPEILLRNVALNFSPSGNKIVHMFSSCIKSDFPADKAAIAEIVCQ